MTIKAKNTRYGQFFFRSRTEARWAVFFDCCGIKWEYEVRPYDLPSGGYLPDFWLPAFHMHLEIKGLIPTDEERQRCAELAEATDRVVLLAEGPPEERFQLRWFDANGEDDRLYAIARDRNSEAGFWLVADDLGDSSRWFGGGVPGIEMRRGPMFSGALEQAYETALAVRFDLGEGRRRFPVIPETDVARTEPRTVVLESYEGFA